jgi:hypothetical protein
MTESVMTHTRAKAPAQPWLQSCAWDLLYIISPAFVTSAVAILFKEQFENMRSLPLWAWVCLVLFVDVAHVYATLFRTYFDKKALAANATLLATVPMACWGTGALLYSIDGLLFWRVLAYLAVFHFIRQQYGFVALYSRNDADVARKYSFIDGAVVYLATLYPLLYWHTNLPRNFNWFVEGDFVSIVPQAFAEFALALYLIVALAYFAKEFWSFKISGSMNAPKNLILIGTALSWWIAIVSVNSDMTFTMVNVISHGVPYMALIWLYQQRSLQKGGGGKTLPLAVEAGGLRQAEVRALATYSHATVGAPEPLAAEQNSFSQRALKLLSYSLPAFVIFLIVLAYLEEGLWDGFVWREHLSVFAPFNFLPQVTDKSFLALLVPFLALPQSTHYVLDGFIWKVKKRSSVWSA